MEIKILTTIVLHGFQQFFTVINYITNSYSRLFVRWTPPSTPEGYWDLTVRTPEKWKQQDHENDNL